MNVGQRVVEILIKAKDEASKDVKALGKSFDELKRQVPIVGAAFELIKNPIVVVTGLLVGMAKSAKMAYDASINLGDGFDKMSARSRIAVEDLVKWDHVMGLAGGTSSEFEAAFVKLQRSMYAASKGLGEQVRLFNDVGVSATNADGSLRPVVDVMMDLADVLKTAKEGSNKFAAASMLVAEGQSTMNAVLRQGSVAIREQMDVASAMAPHMTKEWAKVGAAAKDAQLQTKLIMDDWKASLTPDFTIPLAKWNFFWMSIANPGAIDRIAEIRKNAHDAAVAALDGLGGALFAGGQAAAWADAPDKFAEQLITDKALQKALDEAMANVKPGASVAKNADAAEIFFGTDWATGLETGALAMEDLLNTTIGDALTSTSSGVQELTDAVREYTDAENAAYAGAQSLAYGLSDIAGQATVAFLTGTASAMKFGDMIKGAVLDAIRQMIAELIRAKILMAALKLIGLKDGGQVPMAFGGAIPRAANGYAVPDGPRGMDSRLIMAMPGEEVINRSLSRRLDRFISSYEMGAAVSPFALKGAGGGRGNVINFNVGRPVSVLDALDLGRNAVTASRKFSEAML